MAITKEELDKYIIAYDRGTPLISDEEWKVIEYRDICHDTYEISNNGKIRVISTNRIVPTHIWGPGYVFVRLKLNDPGKTNLFSVHRIVGWHFVPGYTKEKCIINHIDGDKTNNYYRNLEWCTQRHNAKHAHETGLCVTRYGEETNRHFVNAQTVDRICRLLIKYDGHIKPVLDIILSDGIYCTFGIIECIKSKETWNKISDKYFTKDYFKNKRVSEIERICESIVKYSGDISSVVTEFKDDIPNVSPKFVSSLKDGSTYPNITMKYFKPNQYKRQHLFDESQVIKICESIVKNKGDPKKVYDELKDVIGDNLTVARINDIKQKGSYMNISDRYFSKGEFPRIDIDNIDFVRSLLILDIFKGSPIAVYNALNHDKYPKLTKSVTAMIKQKHPAYMKSNNYDLTKYYTDIKENRFQHVSKELIDRLINSYQSGNSDVTDESYDQLLEEYLAEHGEDKRPFLRQKQSSSVNDIVGTLPKRYGVRTTMRDNQKPYTEWVEKIQKGGILQAPIIIQPKFDGCSVACDIPTGRFYTRGDYDNGESVEVTDLFANRMDDIRGMVTDDTIAIKFEAILDRDAYQSTPLKSYKRPRDAVQATISSHNKEYANLITLVPLRAITNTQAQYIPEDLFHICLKANMDDYSTIENYIKSVLDDNATVRFAEKTFDIDGVVVSISEARQSLPSMIDPNHEVAIKILFNVKLGTLKTIDFQFGKQGRITPVAILDPPVEFDKVKVDHVTLSTLQRVVDMQLRHNDTVRVMYNIVPYLIDSQHDGDYPIPVPQKCPICGADLDYLSYKLVRCSNPNCKGLRLGAIIRHAEKMKMFGLSKGIITKLYDNEFVLCISDLYDLRKWDDCIAQMPGFGYTSYDNMLKSVDTALANATLERFLGALPFNDIDEKTWKLVVNAVGRDKLIQSMVDGTFPEMIMGVGYIPNVKTAKIQRMVDGYLRNKEELQTLMEWIPPKLKEPLPKYITQKGRVCFTGFRDKELEQKLIDNGWDVGGFTKDMKYLIVPDLDYTSEKVRKAKELGIEVVDRDRVPYYLFQPF